MEFKLKLSKSALTFSFILGLSVVLICGYLAKGRQNQKEPDTNSKLPLELKSDLLVSSLSQSSQLETKAMVKSEKNIGASTEAPDLLKNWVDSGFQGSRDSILAAANKNPIVFIHNVKEILEKIPSDKVAYLNQILALAIDVATEVRNETDRSRRNEFFKEVKDIFEYEMIRPELVESTTLNTLTEGQKHGLVHTGQLIERNGIFFVSTFQSKIIALQLAARIPDLAERKTVAQRILAGTYTQLEPYTQESISLATRDLLNDSL